METTRKKKKPSYKKSYILHNFVATLHFKQEYSKVLKRPLKILKCTCEKLFAKNHLVFLHRRPMKVFTVHIRLSLL